MPSFVTDGNVVGYGLNYAYPTGNTKQLSITGMLSVDGAYAMEGGGLVVGPQGYLNGIASVIGPWFSLSLESFGLISTNGHNTANGWKQGWTWGGLIGASIYGVARGNFPVNPQVFTTLPGESLGFEGFFSAFKSPNVSAPYTVTVTMEELLLNSMGIEGQNTRGFVWFVTSVDISCGGASFSASLPAIDPTITAQPMNKGGGPPVNTLWTGHAWAGALLSYTDNLGTLLGSSTVKSSGYGFSATVNVAGGENSPPGFSGARWSSGNNFETSYFTTLTNIAGNQFNQAINFEANTSGTSFSNGTTAEPPTSVIWQPTMAKRISAKVYQIDGTERPDLETALQGFLDTQGINAKYLASGPFYSTQVASSSETFDIHNQPYNGHFPDVNLLALDAFDEQFAGSLGSYCGDPSNAGGYFWTKYADPMPDDTLGTVVVSRKSQQSSVTTVTGLTLSGKGAASAHGGPWPSWREYRWLGLQGTFKGNCTLNVSEISTENSSPPAVAIPSQSSYAIGKPDNTGTVWIDLANPPVPLIPVFSHGAITGYSPLSGGSPSWGRGIDTPVALSITSKDPNCDVNITGFLLQERHWSEARLIPDIQTDLSGPNGRGSLVVEGYRPGNSFTDPGNGTTANVLNLMLITDGKRVSFIIDPVLMRDRNFGQLNSYQSQLNYSFAPNVLLADAANLPAYIAYEDSPFFKSDNFNKFGAGQSVEFTLKNKRSEWNQSLWISLGMGVRPITMTWIVGTAIQGLTFPARNGTLKFSNPNELISRLAGTSILKDATATVDADTGFFRAATVSSHIKSQQARPPLDILIESFEFDAIYSLIYWAYYPTGGVHPSNYAHKWGDYHKVLDGPGGILYSRAHGVPLNPTDFPVASSLIAATPAGSVDSEARTSMGPRARLYTHFTRTTGNTSSVLEAISDDDGQTWNVPTAMPIQNGQHPIIAHGNNGETVRAAYVDANGSSGTIQATFQGPGDPQQGQVFTFSDKTGAPLSVANDTFGLSHMHELGSRWMLHVLIAGDTNTSDWYSADECQTWTKVV